MTVRFCLPDVGEGLESGEIVAWLVSEGDEVTRDQPLVEIQTDKALVELPSPATGRVVSLAATPGDVVPVGQLLVVLEPATEVVEPQDRNSPGPGARQERAMASGGEAGKPGAGRPKAAPAVRKLARERGIDLTVLTGTGPGGRILAADLDHPGPGPIPTGVPERRTARVPNAATAAGGPGLGQIPPGRHPLRGIRRVTAEAMSRSWSQIPHLTAMDELDATSLVEAKEHLAGVSYPALFVAACARALRLYPLINASLDGEEIVVHHHCSIGVAVATESGLVVPVVRDADQRSLPDLAGEVTRLVNAARAGKVELADLQGGTFTVTNYGTLGGRFATPLIRPPEAGIMGFGAIRPRPVVKDGAVVAGPTLPYCLSVDHRLVDGDVATAFAGHVAALLTAPIRLFADPPGR